MEILMHTFFSDPEVFKNSKKYGPAVVFKTIQTAAQLPENYVCKMINFDSEQNWDIFKIYRLLTFNMLVQILTKIGHSINTWWLTKDYPNNMTETRKELPALLKW